MKKSYILLLAALFLVIACDKNVIIDEATYQDKDFEGPIVGELEASIYKPAYNYVVISFDRETTGDLLLDGVPLFKFEKQYYVRISNLNPRTHYNVRVRSKMDGKLYCHDFDFTTPDAFLYYLGGQEMDLELDETRIIDICPLPDGDLIENTCIGLRRTDTAGKVKWRLPISDISSINCNYDGQIICNDRVHAYRVNAETGKIMSTFSPTDSNMILCDACIGKDGSAVLVGYKHYILDNGFCKKYYIGHFDADGNVLSEQFDGTEPENYMRSVIAKPDGSYLVAGQFGIYDAAFLTLDKDCNVIKTTIDHNPQRDDYYGLEFKHGCMDEEGNTYFIARESVYFYYAFCTTMVIKVNPESNIDWIRKFAGTTTYTSPSFMRIVGGDPVAVFSQEADTYYTIKPNIVVFDKSGNLQKGIKFNEVFTILHVEAITPLEQYAVYDEYGDILLCNVDGDGQGTFVGFRENILKD